MHECKQVQVDLLTKLKLDATERRMNYSDMISERSSSDGVSRLIQA